MKKTHLMTAALVSTALVSVLLISACGSGSDRGVEVRPRDAVEQISDPSLVEGADQVPRQ